MHSGLTQQMCLLWQAVRTFIAESNKMHLAAV